VILQTSIIIKLCYLSFKHDIKNLRARIIQTHRLECTDESDDYQKIWFQKKSFQSVLKRAVDYYTHHGSHVFCAFTDFSKAFDSVNYWLLFCKLIDNNNTVQCCMTVRLLAYWYRNLQLFVRWQNAVSDPFLMSNGVRQGAYCPHFYFDFTFVILLQS